MASIDTYTTKTGQTMYRVRVQRKGYKTQTATFPRLSDAKRYGALVEGQLIAGKHFPQKSHYTLSDLLEKHTSDILPRKTPETARSQKPAIAYG